MYLNKRNPIDWINSGFQSRFLVTISLLFLLVSCHSVSGPDLKKDKELRLQVKPVMLIENDRISGKDITDMISRSTIRRGGFVAIISTSLKGEDNKAANLKKLFYNWIEAVHIVNVDPHVVLKNTDILTIENATILCLLDGDVEKFVQLEAYPELKSAILDAYKKGTLVVMNGNACLLAEDPYFNFSDETLIRKVD